jgi:hypothetical protein
VLAPPRKFTDEDWQLLVRNRAGLIADYLRDFSTEPLGNMTFPGLGEQLSELQPRLVHPEIGLDTRGIFKGLQLRPESRKKSKEYYNGWGLDRNGKWLLVRLIREFTYDDFNRRSIYRKHPTLKVELVSQSRIYRLYSRGVRDVWYELGQAANRLIERRRKAWLSAESLAYNLTAEDEFLRVTNLH